MKRKNSPSGGPTRATSKRQRATKTTLQHVASDDRYYDETSDDEMATTSRKRKKRRPEIVWSSDDDDPPSKKLKKVHVEKQLDPKNKIPNKGQTKRSIPDDWAIDDQSSRKKQQRFNPQRQNAEPPSDDDDDDIPLSQWVEKRKKARDAARGPKPIESATDALLKSIYYNPAHPASFGSQAKLTAAAGVSRKVVANWLAKQDTYTLTRKVIRKFKRSRYMVHDIGALFQCDLIDMRNLSEYNDAVFLLTCIDCFSRRLWVIPLPDKRGVTVVDAFKTIFQDLRPRKITFDLGKEFFNKHVLGYLKQLKIKYYGTVDKAKSALVERVNLTLRQKLNRVMTARGTRGYLKFLPEIVLGYNLAKNSATGMAPLAITSKDVPKVWDFLYGGTGRYKKVKTFDARKPKLQQGDRVRLAKDLDTYEKASANFGWTSEVFTVDNVTRADPSMFSVRDDANEKITGRLYTAELQRIDKAVDGGVYMIDKIKEVKGRGASRRLLVSWKGYESPKFDSWIKESDLEKL